MASTPTCCTCAGTADSRRRAPGAGQPSMVCGLAGGEPRHHASPAAHTRRRAGAPAFRKTSAAPRRRRPRRRRFPLGAGDVELAPADRPHPDRLAHHGGANARLQRPRVARRAHRLAQDGASILLLDLRSGKAKPLRLGDKAQATWQPAVSERYVVWFEGARIGAPSADAWTYDVATRRRRQIVTLDDVLSFPSVFGARTVWCTARGAEPESLASTRRTTRVSPSRPSMVDR